MRGAIPLRHPVAPGAEHAIEARGTRSSGPRDCPQPMIFSTSASMTGSAMPARLYEPLVAAACEEKIRTHRCRPASPTWCRRSIVMSKSKILDAGAILHGVDQRAAGVDAERAEILDEGRMVRLERRLVEQEFDGEHLAVRQQPLAVLDRKARRPAAIASALRNSARSWPDPSDTGGTKGSPNTSSGTLPRNGSSSFSSSGDGGPSPPCPSSGTATRCAHRRRT